MMPSLTDTFIAHQAFPLDDFQRRACEALESDRGVLVCAPTGAGKTIVGEFAVFLALSRGTKCFYTTPIKALSNQKFHDLRRIHGSDAVGLLTGDVSINPHADVVVMTTEVLRNMIYAESEALHRLSHVVMDEIHFLADRSRGAVWEEAILSLHESVRVVGLSATVSNSEEFGRWLDTVRGETEVIVTDHRPIPLRQWMLVGKRMHELFEPGSDLSDPHESPEVNRRLLRHVERLDEPSNTASEPHQWQRGGFRARTGGGKSQHGARHSQRSGVPRAQDRYRPLGRADVIDILHQHDMLPAITFIFSRAGCDAAVAQCARSSLVLTTQAEAARIAEVIDAGVEGIPEEDLKVLDFRRWRASLMRGFAAHHAGMLPAFRHIVEALFTEGLVRVVFATETLALGINMPARTVVLEKLVKFNGEAHVDLTPGQYTQLTGRAGRRGIDTIGNAVVLWAPAMDPEQVAGLASTRTYPLQSTFTPGYNMSVNLLNTMGLDASHRLLEKSFAQFQADGSVVNEARKIERAELAVEQQRAALRGQLPGEDGAQQERIDAALEYTSMRRELSKRERAARQASMRRSLEETVAVLSKLQLGDVIALPTNKRPALAVVVSPAAHASDPKPMVIMEHGWSGRIDADQCAVAPVVLGRIRVPRGAIAHPRRQAKLAVQALRAEHFQRPKKLRPQQHPRDTKEIKQLRREIREHPVHQWPQREQLARHCERLLKATEDVAVLRHQIQQATDTLRSTFDRILELLTELGYVESTPEGPKVTEEGQRLATVHNESDLLVAQCLRRGIWNELDPAELAGVVSLCTFENRKETRGELEAPTEAMATAIAHTQRLWNELSVDERRQRLPITRQPDAAFSVAVHQWTAGAPLGYCLTAAAQCGAELTPGDFVRQCRQVIDLLEQVRSTAYTKDLARSARQAIAAMRRGVVALGS